MSNNNVKNKVVLILGGTGGIGNVIADFLESKGARVCRQGRSGEYAADVRKRGQIGVVVDKVVGRFRRIDAVVNALSAPTHIANAERKTWVDFLNHFNVQLKALVDTLGLVFPIMKKQGSGKIVNILSSYVVGSPPAGLADYISAKYAMLGFTKVLAKEWGRYGIGVNAVSPSFIKNNFTKNVPEKLEDLIVSQTPLGRLATAEDVAQVVAFLISDQANYITGENIILAGGSVMR